MLSQGPYKWKKEAGERENQRKTQPNIASFEERAMSQGLCGQLLEAGKQGNGFFFGATSLTP